MCLKLEIKKRDVECCQCVCHKGLMSIRKKMSKFNEITDSVPRRDC